MRKNSVELEQRVGRSGRRSSAPIVDAAAPFVVTFQYMLARHLRRRLFGTHKASTLGVRLVGLGLVSAVTVFVVAQVDEQTDLLGADIYRCTGGSDNATTRYTLSQVLANNASGAENATCMFYDAGVTETRTRRSWLTSHIIVWFICVIIGMFVVAPRVAKLIRWWIWSYVFLSSATMFFTGLPAISVEGENCVDDECTVNQFMYWVLIFLLIW